MSLNCGLPVLATQLLHRGLVAQLGERLRGQVRDGVRGFELRELLERVDAGGFELLHLARADVGDLVQAVLVLRSCALQWSCQWHWGHLAQGLGLVGSAVARLSIVSVNRPSSRRKYREYSLQVNVTCSRVPSTTCIACGSSCCTLASRSP